MPEARFAAAAFVERADCRRRQRALVGDEDERLAGLGIFEPDAPQMLRIMLTGLDSGECDGLVADDAGGTVGEA